MRTTVPGDASGQLRDWASRGTTRRLVDTEIFTMDLGPVGRELREPLLVVHGFPTSCFDFHLVVDELRANRRVLLLDLAGYGLSEKKDRRYTMSLQADIVAAFVAEAEVHALALLTHDMGDTVGGELLARQMEGSWPVEVTSRILTNGSIYIEMAKLSVGQELLLSLPDEALPEGTGADEDALASSLAATFSPKSTVETGELDDLARLVCHRGGSRMLPRLIRYIEERRANQGRFTGAIERHPAPLQVIWGADDPIAVVAMVGRLHEARSDASVSVLEGVGHFPMLEAPGRLLEAMGERSA